MCRIVFGIDIDVIIVEEEVLGTKKRVRKGFVCVVDQGRESEGFAIGGCGGVFVGMVEGLDLEELASEEGGVDVEGT